MMNVPPFGGLFGGVRLGAAQPLHPSHHQPAMGKNH